MKLEQRWGWYWSTGNSGVFFNIVSTHQFGTARVVVCGFGRGFNVACLQGLLRLHSSQSVSKSHHKCAEIRSFVLWQPRGLQHMQVLYRGALASIIQCTWSAPESHLSTIPTHVRMSPHCGGFLIVLYPLSLEGAWVPRSRGQSHLHTGSTRHAFGGVRVFWLTRSILRPQQRSPIWLEQ